VVLSRFISGTTTPDMLAVLPCRNILAVSD